MKVHLQVDGSPQKARDSAREIADLGVDGVFSFEGQHDVFFPLVVAAGETDLELMTNVAIAGPRSPLHLAHAHQRLFQRRTRRQPVRHGLVPAVTTAYPTLKVVRVDRI